MFSCRGSQGNIGCRRSQRRSKKSANQNQVEFKVANHLKGEKYLPQPLRQQLQKIEFLSQKTLNQFTYQPLNNYLNHSPDILYRMKIAANRQQEKLQTISFPIQNVGIESNHNVLEQLVYLQSNESKKLIKQLHIFQNNTDDQYNTNEFVAMDLEKNLQFFNDNFQDRSIMNNESNQQMQYESLF